MASALDQGPEAVAGPGPAAAGRKGRAMPVAPDRSGGPRGALARGRPDQTARTEVAAAAGTLGVPTLSRAVPAAELPVPAEPAPDAVAPAAAADQPAAADSILATLDFHVHYPGMHAVRGVNLAFPALGITAIIGPSGCGKSTLLRCLNRMNDRVPGLRIEGRVLFHQADIYAPSIDPVALRRRIGMVFQRPVAFPMSIFENVAYGPRMHGLDRTASALAERVERCLTAAGLWKEVKDRLRQPASALSGGQQQRLCIARALAVDPEVILLDEPTSAIDPVATGHIEDTLLQLGQRFTIVIVTHNLQQAARISDRTAFLMGGELVEYGPTEDLFHQPRDPRTEAYLTGRFG